MSWTLTTEAKAIANAGEGANSTLVGTAATLAAFSDDAEGVVETDTRIDWITLYASLNASIKGALSDAVASLVAMRIIAYDVNGYSTRGADSLINLNNERYKKAVSFLQDMKSIDNIKQPTV